MVASTSFNHTMLVLLSTLLLNLLLHPASSSSSPDSPEEGVRLTIVSNHKRAPLVYSTKDATKTQARKVRNLGYVVQVGVGESRVSDASRAQNMSLMIDTGSDVTWARCGAGPGETTCSGSPRIACTSPVCDDVAEKTKTRRRDCSETDVCEIELVYQDGERVWVDVSEDALSIGGARLPSFTFGAADDSPIWAPNTNNNNNNTNNEAEVNYDDGILGLGRGAYGFPSIARARFGGIFSYCLPASMSDEEGFLYLGGRGAYPGRRGCIPLNLDPDHEDDYVVDIASMSIGNYTNLQANHPMLIDSGTTVTNLEAPLYAVLRQVVRTYVGEQLTLAPARPGDQLDTCYLYPTHGGRPIPDTMYLPDIVFHFEGGVSYEIDNLFIPYDASRLCLGFKPTDLPYSILGNIHQRHKVFTFDTVDSAVCISQGNREFC